ncbi:hypothetical protein B0H11DRAFT_2054639, partial [Mycena galericulata]
MSRKHGRPSAEVSEEEALGKVFKRARNEGVEKIVRPNIEHYHDLPHCNQTTPSGSESDSETPPPRKKKKSTPGGESLGLSPTPRPKGGRPRHKDRGTRTDDAPPAKLTGLDLPQTPRKKRRPKTATSPKTFLSPRSSRIAAFTTQQPTHFQFNSPIRAGGSKTNTGSSRKNPTHKPSTTRTSLKQFNYDPHKGWAAAGSCLTVEAYQRFDTW